MLTHTDDLHRIADTLDKLPKSWQKPQTRADLFLALEAAVEAVDREQRIATWEKVRYLAGFPTGVGLRIPLYAAMSGTSSADPYTDGEPPEFCELLAVLNRAAGWES